MKSQNSLCYPSSWIVVVESIRKSGNLSAEKVGSRILYGCHSFKDFEMSINHSPIPYLRPLSQTSRHYYKCNACICWWPNTALQNGLHIFTLVELVDERNEWCKIWVMEEWKHRSKHTSSTQLLQEPLPSRRTSYWLPNKICSWTDTK